MKLCKDCRHYVKYCTENPRVSFEMGACTREEAPHNGHVIVSIHHCDWWLARPKPGENRRGEV